RPNSPLLVRTPVRSLFVVLRFPAVGLQTVRGAVAWIGSGCLSVRSCRRFRVPALTLGSAACRARCPILSPDLVAFLRRRPGFWQLRWDRFRLCCRPSGGEFPWLRPVRTPTGQSRNSNVGARSANVRKQPPALPRRLSSGALLL